MSGKRCVNKPHIQLDRIIVNSADVVVKEILCMEGVILYPERKTEILVDYLSNTGNTFLNPEKVLQSIFLQKQGIINEL